MRSQHEQNLGTVAFGPFEVDPASRQLRKHGVRIRVPDQPFQILTILMERPGTLITREELKQRLWQNQEHGDFDHGLNAAMNRLRAALGDKADAPQFIETQSKHGYRFIAAIVRAEDQPDAPLQTVVKETETLPPPRRPVVAYHWIGTTAAIAVLLTSATLLWPRRGAPEVLNQLTRDLGLTTDAAVSGDGKLLAYASDRPGPAGTGLAQINEKKVLNIWIQQLAPGGKATQLVHLGSDAVEPEFHPNGATVAFRSSAGIFAVPTIGGEPVQLAPFGRNPRYSPDGKRIAFWTGDEGVFWIDSQGGEPHHIGPSHTSFPVWSPDSRRLLVMRIRPDPSIDWWLLDMETGSATKTGAFAVFTGQGLAMQLNTRPHPSLWREDRVLFSARLGDSVNIWEATLAGDRLTGAARRLTSGTSDVSPTLGADGRLYFTAAEENVGIWSLPINAATGQKRGTVERITRDKVSEVTHSVSQDGRFLAYTALATTIPTLHVLDRSTGRDSLVTSMSSGAWHPILSRDGSRIAFTVRDGPDSGVYVSPNPGGAAAQRVSDGTGYVWDWAKDERHLLSIKKASEDPAIWEIDTEKRVDRVFLKAADGGVLYQAKYSPDYRWLTMLHVTEGQWKVQIVPLKDGLPVGEDRWVNVTSGAVWSDKPRWSPDGNVLYYLSTADGHRCIWAQRLNAADKRPVGDPISVFHSHELPFSIGRVALGFAEVDVSADRIWFTIAESSGNVWSVHRR